MPNPPIRQFQLTNINDNSLWTLCKRHFHILNQSLAHCMGVLATAPIIFALAAPNLDVFGWFRPDGYIFEPTSFLHTLTCWTSTLYYIYDAACIIYLTNKYYGGKISFDDWGYLLHHVSCIIGLSSPALSGFDGPMVLFGFIMGELSSPPRALAEMYEFEMKSMKAALPTLTDDVLQQNGITRDDLSAAYKDLYNRYAVMLEWRWYMFVFLRSFLAWYVFAIMPHAQLGLAYFAAVLMLVFSVGAVFVLYPAGIERRKNHHILEQLYPPVSQKVD